MVPVNVSFRTSLFFNFECSNQVNYGNSPEICCVISKIKACSCVKDLRQLNFWLKEQIVQSHDGIDGHFLFAAGGLCFQCSCRRQKFRKVNPAEKVTYSNLCSDDLCWLHLIFSVYISVYLSCNLVTMQSRQTLEIL